MRSWLFTILHNVWRNDRRRRAAESIDSDPMLVRLLPALPSTADRDLDQTAATARLRTAIDALPEAYRETVVLRFGEGFSYQEIATILGCPAGTVMSRLGRARSLLRRAMTASGPRRVVGGRT